MKLCSGVAVRHLVAQGALPRSVGSAGRAWINKRRSVIVDPRGNVVADPSEGKKEILYAEIDLATVRAAKHMFDVAGHCSRRDVFRFEVSAHSVAE